MLSAFQYCLYFCNVLFLFHSTTMNHSAMLHTGDRDICEFQAVSGHNGCLIILDILNLLGGCKYKIYNLKKYILNPPCKLKIYNMTVCPVVWNGLSRLYPFSPSFGNFLHTNHVTCYIKTRWRIVWAFLFNKKLGTTKNSKRYKGWSKIRGQARWN